MDDYNNLALSRVMPGILKFYQYGLDGCTPPERGAFVKKMLVRDPDLTQDNMELIQIIDRFCIIFYEAGRKNRIS